MPETVTDLTPHFAAITARIRAGSDMASAAKTDGTDQAPVIQAEIDALSAAGGGRLRLPRGTVSAGPIVLKSRVGLVGHGRQATKLVRLNSGTTTGPFVASNQWATRYNVAETAGYPVELSVRDITLDANNVGSHALAIHSPGYQIDGVDLLNAPDLGFRSSFGGGLVANEKIEPRVHDLRVINCQTGAIYISGPSDGMFSKIITVSDRADLTDDQCHIVVTGTAWATVFTDVHCWGSPATAIRATVPVQINNPILEPYTGRAGGIARCLLFDGPAGDQKYKVNGGVLFFGGAPADRAKAKGVTFANNAAGLSMVGTVINNCSAAAIDWTGHAETTSVFKGILINEDGSTAKTGGPFVGFRPVQVQIDCVHDTGSGPTQHSITSTLNSIATYQASATIPAQDITETWQGSTVPIFRVRGKYDSAVNGFPELFSVSPGGVVRVNGQPIGSGGTTTITAASDVALSAGV